MKSTTSSQKSSQILPLSLLVIVCFRVQLTKKQRIAKKEKAPKSYRVSKDEERFNAFSFDVIIFFLLFERVILMVNH